MYTSAVVAWLVLGTAPIVLSGPLGLSAGFWVGALSFVGPSDQNPVGEPGSQKATQSAQLEKARQSDWELCFLNLARSAAMYDVEAGTAQSN